MCQETSTTPPGPCLNGHAPLDIPEVQAWFQKAKCSISDDAAAAIARLLNEYDLLSAWWKNTSALQQLRQNNPSELRNRRIAAALLTLQTDLPITIDDTRKIHHDRETEALRLVAGFLDQLNLVAPLFQPFLASRGRNPERWHIIARKIGPMIVDAFKTSEGRQVGFGQPTSPAIEILQSALDHLGVTASPVAVVDAMRPKRVRKRRVRKKGLGKISP
jgi:hypothetical protein